jgi:DNA-binding NarL/FixJ family response regulator
MSGNTTQHSDRIFTIVLRCRDGLLRDALSDWINAQPGYAVAGASATSTGLLRLCELRAPDVAVIEFRTVGRDDLDLLMSLARHQALRVIGLHNAMDPRDVAVLLRAGVDRFVSKRSGLIRLLEALTEVQGRRGRTITGGLTERELEVLALICAGRSATEIAEALAISPHTVINHKRRIYAKLEVQSRTEAAAEVGRLGLRLNDDATRENRERGPKDGDLTQRERDILDSIARGESVRQTAQSLGIAIKTVQCEQRQLFTKLRARNRPEALARARRLGLVDLGGSRQS